MPGRPARTRSPLLLIADEAVRSLTPFADYDAYQDRDINGDWFNRKREYHAWRNFEETAPCYVCVKANVQASGPLDVHHHRYDTLGREGPEDLELLCEEHHDGYHRWLETPDALGPESLDAYCTQVERLERSEEARRTARDAGGGYCYVCGATAPGFTVLCDVHWRELLTR